MRKTHGIEMDRVKCNKCKTFCERVVADLAGTCKRPYALLWPALLYSTCASTSFA